MSSDMNDSAAGELVLFADNVYRSFSDGDISAEVLKGVSLSIRAGERVAIVGSSGSGKTTLLNILGGLDLPDQGSVSLVGESLSAVSELERSRIRNQHLGVVYQFHHLLPEFTALENVMMPLLIGKTNKKEMVLRAERLLERVGLADRVGHKPSELSGGERQRVAIARALITNPKVVLADEPTGNLDTRTATQVQDLMSELNKSLSTAFIVVTHDQELAKSMDRVLQMQDGRFV